MISSEEGAAIYARTGAVLDLPTAWRLCAELGSDLAAELRRKPGEEVWLCEGTEEQCMAFWRELHPERFELTRFYLRTIRYEPYGESVSMTRAVDRENRRREARSARTEAHRERPDRP